MKNVLKTFFYFTRTERRGILLLCTLILLVSGGTQVYRHWQEKASRPSAEERAEQLRFGKAEISVDEVSRMTKEQKAAMYASAALLSAVHREVEQYEDDNVGIKSAHEAEKGAELVGRVSDSRYAKKLKKSGKICCWSRTGFITVICLWRARITGSGRQSEERSAHVGRDSCDPQF